MPSPVRLSPLVLTAIIFTLLAWGSAFIVIRGVAPEIGGGALALGRLLVGTLALGVLMLIARRWLRPTRREWLLLLLYGVAWFGAYNVTLNLAEHTPRRRNDGDDRQHRADPDRARCRHLPRRGGAEVAPDRRERRHSRESC